MVGAVFEAVEGFAEGELADDVEGGELARVDQSECARDTPGQL